MKPILDGTVALVTGASSGIGAATAAGDDRTRKKPTTSQFAQIAGAIRDAMMSPDQASSSSS